MLESQNTMNEKYKLIKVGNKWVHEHRYVMEVHIGRKLCGIHEVVHHRNGDKHDNRLENLELMYKRNHDQLNPTVFKPGHRNADAKVAERRVQIEQLRSFGWSFRKIASHLGIHHGTVQHYLCRGAVLASRRRNRKPMDGNPSWEYCGLCQPNRG